MAPVYCLAPYRAGKFSTPAGCSGLLDSDACFIVQKTPPHHFGSLPRPGLARTGEKKAHHAVRSNLPRFRLLGSASNIL